MPALSFLDALTLLGEETLPEVHAYMRAADSTGPLHTNSIALLAGALGLAMYDAYAADKEMSEDSALAFLAVRESLFHGKEGLLKDIAPDHSCYRIFFDALEKKGIPLVSTSTDDLPSLNKIKTDYWGWLPDDFPEGQQTYFDFMPSSKDFYDYTKEITRRKIEEFDQKKEPASPDSLRRARLFGFIAEAIIKGKEIRGMEEEIKALDKKKEEKKKPKSESAHSEEFYKAACLSVLIGALTGAIAQSDKDRDPSRRLPAEAGQRLALSVSFASLLTSIPAGPQTPNPKVVRILKGPVQ